MGIYDRDYYRRQGPSFLGSLGSHGQICKTLIIINVVAFVIQLATREFIGMRGVLPGRFTDVFILDAQSVLDGQVWRLLSYAFLHSTTTIWHILFNMLFLWWFGSDVEDLYGPREFLAFYLVSAFLGGVAFTLVYLYQPMQQFCLGASGAVTAVLVLCAMHYPSRVIYVWYILPVPIWLFVVFQVAQDSFTFLTGLENSTTAVSVHLAGAAFAFVYYKRHWRIMDIWPKLQGWKRERSRPRLRVYREETAEPVSVTAQPVPEVDEHLEAKLDAVLEKVARTGKESLTDSERQILVRASEIYKRRRT